MREIVLIIHVVVGVLFILFVLMQDRGVGFGGAIGGVGGGGFYATKRGAAKVIHYMSVVFCVIFLSSALIYFLVPASEIVNDPAPISIDSTTDTPEGITIDDLTVDNE